MFSHCFKYESKLLNCVVNPILIIIIEKSSKPKPWSTVFNEFQKFAKN